MQDTKERAHGETRERPRDGLSLAERHCFRLEGRGLACVGGKFGSGHLEDTVRVTLLIKYALLTLASNTTRVRDMKQYMLAVLYNASITMNAYYQNWVQHDMAKGLA